MLETLDGAARNGETYATELLATPLAARARSVPDAPALVFEQRVLSYAEVDRRSSQLAHALRARGVGPEVRVGVSLERSPDAILSILAVIKAGGVYVPLDPSYPAERLSYMLRDCAARLLITRAEVAAGLPDGAWEIMDLDRAGDEIGRMPESAPEVAVDRDNLAYVIYTSGSTGRPKGVMVSHRGIANLARAQAAAWQVDERSRVLQFASLSFDASVAEMAMTFFAGAALVLARREAMLPGEGFVSLLRGERITHLTLSPSVLTQLPPAKLPELRLLVVAGEACASGLVEAWGAGRRFWNAYGPTEATVCAAMGPCVPGQPVTLGRALPGVRTYVLDAALQPVAQGAAGELCVGGTGLARGYHARPGVTADRFLPDPFACEAGARLYRTGDFVRRLADGRLEYLGRTDQQVKVRGHRIELGEVESVLQAHPMVSSAVVTAYDAADGLRTLCAYYVPGPDGGGEAELRDWAAKRLPAFMVPTAWVRLADLPLSPSGKADRARLPHPETVLRDAGRPVVEPRTPTEHALAAIWREVLGVATVGVDEPFLEMGGHSLRGIRVLARIAAAFGVDVPAHVLLRSGTIQQLAAIVDGAGRDVRDAGPALVPAPRDGRIPLSYSQEATWFFEQFAPGLMAYRAQATLRLYGELDVAVLERALGEIVARHEIFRTTFPVEDGLPVQRIHAPWTVRVPVVDATGMDDAAVRALAGREFRAPFDTGSLPLVRWTLLRRAEDDHVLVMVEHHFVHDGWSFGIFLTELRALYTAFLAGEPSPLPPPTVQFADFAVWQRRWVDSAAGQAGLRYWKTALAGVPPLALPTDAPRPAVMRFRGAAERVTLPPALAARAAAFSREHGVTLFVTLMAAFQALLGRYSGQRDFAVGSGLGNRGSVAVEGIIGMVVNTVAIRAGLDGDPTGAELLRRVRDTTLAAYEHQDVPFDQVVKRIHPERSGSALPVYQVAFSFHNAPMPDLDFGPVRLEIEEAQNNGSAKFDIQVVGIPRGEQGAHGGDDVVLVWEYNTDLFERDTLHRMIRHYETLLAGLMDHPARAVSRLPLLGDAERARVVDEWNPAHAPATGPLVHQAVAAHARRAPDVPAIACGGAVLSYGELDERASRLARLLRGRGVGTDACVGVCLERGIDLVVANVAVLKAGGAYVAMDPAYPAERLAHMAADSGVRVLLTQSSLRGSIAFEGNVEVVEVDGDGPRIAAESAEPVECGADACSLAYVIYTSGSTGTPKGVAVEHGGLRALCDWHADAFGVTAADHATQMASPGFDASAWEVWPYLARGACVHVVPDEVRADPEGLRDWLVRAGTTVAFVPTPVAEPLLALEWPRATALRWLLAGGDRLQSRPGADVPFRLSNNYGPTECTVVATSAVVDRGGARAPSIGRPIAGTRVYVLDAGMAPVPVGVPGELFISGVQVARGYLHRPRMTAERFLPDPFAAQPGARMYRSGDQVRWLADGTLDYLGRLDEQVKIRGFRIELGEIEAALRHHPGVRDCVVLAQEEAPGDRRLVAWLATDPGAARPAELREHLRRTLPEYMVPAAFVAMDHLPLTAHGKLDRRALPAPEYKAGEEGYVAPATEVETAIAGIWAEVLSLGRVGTNDDFFELGGDSLLSTRVVNRTRDLLRREVPVAILFDHPTLAAFVAAATAPALSASSDAERVAGL
jgi:amino acid adenylation domain-containing protein